MGAVTNQDTNKTEEKPVIFWRGKDKGMILNITNWDTLEEQYGPDSDDWTGQPMILYPTETRFGSKKVPCMRIRIPKGSELKGKGKPAPEPEPEPEDEPPPLSDEDIPHDSWEEDGGEPF
jgi:hypothetical protein